MASAQDTIVAVSSPPGRSPRGLVRVSGPDTRSVVAQLILNPVGDAPDSGGGLAPCVVPWMLCRARLIDPPLPVLLAFFRGPRSYTGQDMAELQCPGHPALLDRVVHAAVASGARLAEPGEFTFRAFLAGKLDLTQAEGVAATIAATSDGQLHAAELLRRGELGRFAGGLVDQLADALALVEAGIDFVDEEGVVPIGPGDLDLRLARVERELHALLSHSRSWGALEALPRIVLVGRPSAGKSTQCK